MNMFPEERKQKICDLVNERHSIKVTELSQLMGISEVTSERLEELSKQKRLLRTMEEPWHVLGGQRNQRKKLIRSNKIFERTGRLPLVYHAQRQGYIFADGPHSS